MIAAEQALRRPLSAVRRKLLHWQGVYEGLGATKPKTVVAATLEVVRCCRLLLWTADVGGDASQGLGGLHVGVGQAAFVDLRICPVQRHDSKRVFITELYEEAGVFEVMDRLRPDVVARIRHDGWS